MDYEETVENVEEKKRKKGIIYLSKIPPYMNVTKIREIMTEFGKIGRVYLQPTTTKPGKSKKKTSRALHFTEGWVEFLSKRVAKEVAVFLNNTQVSTQKKSRYFDEMWNIKYLPRFKWIHLSERLQYERAVFQQRMRTEIAQVKREANHFAQSVEMSEKQKKNKKKVNSSDTMIEYTQRKTDKEIKAMKKKSNVEKVDRTEFLRGLFGDGAVS